MPGILYGRVNMTKQEAIKEVIDLYTDDRCLYPGKDCASFSKEGYCLFDDHSYACLMKRLTELGAVIKGQCLGVSHPHLSAYYTVEPLIKETEGK